MVFTMGWSSDSTISLDKSVFANNSWSEIIEACQTDSVPATWTVGDTKPMLINGTEYNIQIIGKDHDTYTSGGTAPLTFQLGELYGTKYQMNSTSTNSTGWSGSLMRHANLPTILGNMPIGVQSAIKTVEKQTLNGDKNGLEITSDKLFLLSESEVFGSTFCSGGIVEGNQYDYYVDGGSTIKTLKGEPNYWWLRGPLYDNTDYSYGFSHVSSGGSLGNSGATIYYGIVIAFCF